MNIGLILALTPVILAWGLGAGRADRPRASPPSAARRTAVPQAAKGNVIALIEGGELLVVDASNGQTRSRQRVANVPFLSFGPSLALSKSGEEVFIPAPDSAAGVTKVVALNLRTLEFREVLTLRDSARYVWADVGAKTGLLYLMGEHGIRVVVVEPSAGRLVAQWSIAKDTAYNWHVERARISPDEERLYLSYHGGCNASGTPKCTTGIEEIFLASRQLAPCSVPRPSRTMRSISPA